MSVVLWSVCVLAGTLYIHGDKASLMHAINKAVHEKMDSESTCSTLPIIIHRGNRRLTTDVTYDCSALWPWSQLSFVLYFVIYFIFVFSILVGFPLLFVLFCKLCTNIKGMLLQYTMFDLKTQHIYDNSTLTKTRYNQTVGTKRCHKLATICIIFWSLMLWLCFRA